MYRKKWVLFALSEAVTQQSRDGISRALRGCDPLFRASAKSHVIRALREAELETTHVEAAHLARLASFRVARIAFDADSNDLAAVQEEFQSKLGAMKRPPPGPRVLVPVLAFAVIVPLGISAFSFLTRPFEPMNEAHGELFHEEFTELASEAAGGRSLSQALAPFRSGTLPHSVENGMVALTDAALKVRGTEEEVVENQYRAAAVGLNRALAQEKLPYYVDADTYPLGGVSSPILLSFYVQERGLYKSAQREVSVLRLWRLDRLNLVQSKLGYTRASIPYAIVLLDEVENDLVTQILPAVPVGELMSLSDDDTEFSPKPWVAELQKKGGAIVRRHFESVSAAEREAAERLGRLLAKRRQLLSKWRSTIARDGSGLRMPRRLIPEDDYVSGLELIVPRAQLRAWEELHDELLSKDRLKDFELVREAVLRSVERHEVQHRLDYAAELFELPPLLARRMGNLPLQGHSTHSLPMRASLELSAFLSQIADDPAPLLAIVTMSRMVFVKHLLGTPHSYAALVVLESLARELGIETTERLGRRVTRQELAQLLFELGELPPARLRKAAQKAYVAEFGVPLAAVERLPFQQNESWRH